MCFVAFTMLCFFCMILSVLLLWYIAKMQAKTKGYVFSKNMQEGMACTFKLFKGVNSLYFLTEN